MPPHLCDLIQNGWVAKLHGEARRKCVVAADYHRVAQTFLMQMALPACGVNRFCRIAVVILPMRNAVHQADWSIFGHVLRRHASLDWGE